MSKGLRSWVQANWVDIANPKKVKELLLYQEKRKLRAEEDQVRNLTTLGLN